MSRTALDLEGIVKDRLQDPTLKKNPFAAYFIAEELKE